MPIILATQKAERDQEDHGSKPARLNSLRDSVSEKLFTKIGLVEWLKVKTLNSSLSTAKNIIIIFGGGWGMKEQWKG
jgi:hypothetical protein